MHLQTLYLRKRKILPWPMNLNFPLGYQGLTMRKSNGNTLILKGHAQLWDFDAMNGNYNKFSISIAPYGLQLLSFEWGQQ